MDHIGFTDLSHFKSVNQKHNRESDDLRAKTEQHPTFKLNSQTGKNHFRLNFYTMSIQIIEIMVWYSNLNVLVRVSHSVLFRFCSQAVENREKQRINMWLISKNAMLFLHSFSMKWNCLFSWYQQLNSCLKNVPMAKALKRKKTLQSVPIYIASDCIAWKRIT